MIDRKLKYLHRLSKSAAVIAALAALAACSTVPSTGPTGADIRRAAETAAPGLPFRVIEIDNPSAIPAAPVSVLPSTLVNASARPTNLIGANDVLNVTVYEAGVTLFGSVARSTVAAASVGSSSTEQLPPIRVDDAGFITVPFAGRIRAAGHTTTELQSIIRGRLIGMSQDPQVVVTLEDALSNSITLAGEVTKPGRLVLATNRETLSDVIALAGGYKGEAKDLVATIEREGGTFQARLSDLLDSGAGGVRVGPGDRITLQSKPQSFSVLGAPNKVEEIRFPRSRVMLTQAVALAGGARAEQGDAAAIFVFRYVPDAQGIDQPVVYHVNMMKPGAYFLSQRFHMRDGDVLYIGNAQANQPTKIVQLISQLFLPLATARSILPIY